MGPPRYSHDEALVITLLTEDDLVQAAQSGEHEAFVEPGGLCPMAGWFPVHPVFRHLLASAASILSQ